MYFHVLSLLAPQLRSLAYLDPGSGSFLIQLLMAGLLGAGILVKVYWKKIKGLFNRSASKTEDDSQIEQ